jgi:hypothetical protein
MVATNGSTTVRLWDELDSTAAGDSHLLTRRRLELMNVAGWCDESIALACCKSIRGQGDFDVVVVVPSSPVLPADVSGPHSVGGRLRY